MIADSLIAARVTADTKDLFAVLAARQGLTESALLKRLVESALSGVIGPGEAMESLRPLPADTRVSATGRSWQQRVATLCRIYAAEKIVTERELMPSRFNIASKIEINGRGSSI